MQTFSNFFNGACIDFLELADSFHFRFKSMSLLFKFDKVSFIDFVSFQNLNPSLEGLKRLKRSSLADQIRCIGIVFRKLSYLNGAVFSQLVYFVDVEGYLFS